MPAAARDVLWFLGSGSDAPRRLIGTLYSETPNEAAPTNSVRRQHRLRRASREPTEGILDSHARFNGKFVSDRDLRIDGEAQGEIECQGTLVLSPQARVRASIKAHNVVINGDYEGNVDSGGRFEIGSTGRVKGEVKTQVLVIKEGAFFEGTVAMTRKPTGRTSGATVRIEHRVEAQARRPRPAADRPPLPAGAAAAAVDSGIFSSEVIAEPTPPPPAAAGGPPVPATPTDQPGAPPLIVEVTRGDRVESQHRGTIAVTGVDGHLVAHLGDPDEVAFLRSSAKPFQLAPFVASGHFDAYDFPDPVQMLAVMAASHAGRPPRAPGPGRVAHRRTHPGRSAVRNAHPFDAETAQRLARDGSHRTSCVITARASTRRWSSTPRQQAGTSTTTGGPTIHASSSPSRRSRRFPASARAASALRPMAVESSASRSPHAIGRAFARLADRLD